eukprot:TRINITY_DN22093_c0_g1_i1.p1 TRINITY_DN22093_c0_g1~~TRINITY_DN22093_c0_g1_i1.p1  ORF type:complete len:346 (+),score=14.73 TRINITY_DN22093_c0_g1_i1:88-1125(+)
MDTTASSSVLTMPSRLHPAPLGSVSLSTPTSSSRRTRRTSESHNQKIPAQTPTLKQDTNNRATAHANGPRKRPAMRPQKDQHQTTADRGNSVSSYASTYVYTYHTLKRPHSSPTRSCTALLTPNYTARGPGDYNEQSVQNLTKPNMARTRIARSPRMPLLRRPTPGPTNYNPEKPLPSAPRATFGKDKRNASYIPGAIGAQDMMEPVEIDDGPSPASYTTSLKPGVGSKDSSVGVKFSTEKRWGVTTPPEVLDCKTLLAQKSAIKRWIKGAELEHQKYNEGVGFGGRAQSAGPSLRRILNASEAKHNKTKRQRPATADPLALPRSAVTKNPALPKATNGWALDLR